MPISWLTVFLSLGSGAIAAGLAASITAYVSWRIHKSNIDEEYRRILLPEKLKIYKEFIVETHQIKYLISTAIQEPVTAVEMHHKFIRMYYDALNKALLLMPNEVSNNIHKMLDNYLKYITAEYKKELPDLGNMNQQAIKISGKIDRMLFDDLGIEKLSVRPK